MAKWIVFKQQGSRSASTKRVSLSVRGVITLNQLAYEELGSPQAVELLFDPEEKLIGLRPVEKSVRHGYRVRKQGKNNSYLIGAKAFCNFNSIEHSETKAFNEVAMDDDVMVLNLKQMTPIVGRRTPSGQTSLFKETVTSNE